MTDLEQAMKKFGDVMEQTSQAIYDFAHLLPDELVEAAQRAATRRGQAALESHDAVDFYFYQEVTRAVLDVVAEWEAGQCYPDAE